MISFKSTFTFAAVAALALVPTLNAATNVYNVGTADFDPNKDQNFNYDWDGQLPQGVSTTGSVAGNSFWSGNIPATSGANTNYVGFRFTPAAVDMTGLTVGDIQSLTYDTRNDGGIDWYAQIYTVGDANNWYGHRINYESDDTTHGWTTENVADLGYSSIKTKSSGAEVYDNDANFASLLASIQDEQILYINFSASYATNGPAANTYLDNIVLTPTESSGFSAAQVNLVPEPTTVALLGLGAIGLLRRRRRQA